MLNFLKRKLKSQKGAMDKILVTLLLVVIGVGLVVGLQDWIEGQKETLQTKANQSIDNATKNM
jgi:hypothetical protein